MHQDSLFDPDLAMPGGRKTTVLLEGDFGEGELEFILELADQWGWRLLSLKALGGTIPDDVPFSGALIHDLPDGPVATELLKRGCPAVRVGMVTHPSDQLLPVVIRDEAAAGRLAAEHFFERNFRELAFVGWWSNTKDSAHYPLFDGFVRRGQELGANVAYQSLARFMHEPEAERFEHRAQAMASLLKDLPKPVGILTINDGVADSLCRMCASQGIMVPEKVAVLGSGNRPQFCQLGRMRLSSVAFAVDGLVARAMGLLRGLMCGEPAPQKPVWVPPVGVATRTSTDVLAVRDPMVARAVRYIWDNLKETMAVEDVAGAIGVSRRTLERGFQKELGRGVRAELYRRRVQVFRRLLATTDATVTDLAAEVGYGSQETMNRAFRRVYGITPSEYRLSLRR